MKISLYYNLGCKNKTFPVTVTTIEPSQSSRSDTCGPDTYTLGCQNPSNGSKMSHEKKKRGPLLSMKYWLFNKDPYDGL